jgi:hypothetical protein
MSSWIIVVIIFIIIIAILTAILIKNRYFTADVVYEFIGGGERRRKHIVKDLDKYPRSKSEKLIIDILENITAKKFPTVRPAWLVYNGSQLELDGYNEELKLAIEFSGPQHVKWTPGAEPYEKYYERIMRDVAKRDLCDREGVILIVVDSSLPRHHWRSYLKSRLYDAGILENMPPVYLEEQVVHPWRNDDLLIKA